MGFHQSKEVVKYIPHSTVKACSRDMVQNGVDKIKEN